MSRIPSALLTMAQSVAHRPFNSSFQEQQEHGFMTVSTPELNRIDASIVHIEMNADESRREGDILSRHELQNLPPMPPIWQHPVRATLWLMNACLGLLMLTALLAFAATLPVINVLVLGYLMEVQGRVARTGKLRSAFYLIPAAHRLGVIVLTVSLFLWPISFLGSVTRDSWLLSLGGNTTWLLATLLALLCILTTVHLLLAIGCGGSLARFIRPVSNIRRLRQWLRNGTYWDQAHLQILEFVAAFRFLHMIRLGLLALAATYVWLSLPALLFTSLDDLTSRWQQLTLLVGSVSMTVMFLWMPMLLAHVAAEDRLAAIVELNTVRKLAGRLPFRWALASAILFACSILPMLYEALLKNRLPPHTVRWDLMLVFLVTIVPARLLTGWVYHRCVHCEPREHSWSWRAWQWGNGMLLCAGVGYYVYFLYLAQTGGELGKLVVWQFHAFLLPFP